MQPENDVLVAHVTLPQEAGTYFLDVDISEPGYSPVKMTTEVCLLFRFCYLLFPAFELPSLGLHLLILRSRFGFCRSQAG